MFLNLGPGYPFKQYIKQELSNIVPMKVIQ